MLRNARSIVGSYKEAAEIAEPLVKLRTLAQLARPGEDVSEDFDKLVKGLEIKGVTQNPEQFREYMEGIAKGINVFGDTLRPYEYYEMFKYGRQASPGLSEKFILGTGPTLAQELGGEGFGAAVAQFNRLLVSGVGKKGSFEELARLGLIDKNDVANIPGTGEGPRAQGRPQRSRAGNSRNPTRTNGSSNIFCRRSTRPGSRTKTSSCARSACCSRASAPGNWSTFLRRNSRASKRTPRSSPTRKASPLPIWRSARTRVLHGRV